MLRKSAYWRVVIPRLQQFVHASSAQLRQLKQLILQRLKNRPQDKRSHMKSQFQRGLRYYNIAIQRHSSGIPHLDVLLIYDKSLQRQLHDFDFLLKHGNVTTYRKLNSAILNYGKKQDPEPLSNLPEDFAAVLAFSEFKKNPYRYLELQMLKDPLGFNLQQYVQAHQLAQHISSWSSLKTKLKDMQVAAANLKLKSKSGLKPITRSLIESRLNFHQLQQYDSWDGYQTIVNCVNQLIDCPNSEVSLANPMHTKHLLITGFQSGIGKTSLVEHNPLRDKKCPYPGLQHYYSTYKLKVAETYFPPYRPYCYNLVYWDQFKIDSKLFPKKNYDVLLTYLGGSECLLPIKHQKAVSRQDHPFHIMTSNYSLDQHIQVTFSSLKAREQAKSNLRDRLVQVQVPKGKSLHFLRKLFVSKV